MYIPGGKNERKEKKGIKYGQIQIQIGRPYDRMPKRLVKTDRKGEKDRKRYFFKK